MLLTRENGNLKVFADAYSLEIAKDRPFVVVEDAHGRKIADLFALASVHPTCGKDDTTDVGTWRAEETLDEIMFVLEMQSSAWERKIARFHCQPRRFRYEIEVTGRGDLDEVVYFGGYSSAHLRWGSGFFQSGRKFEQVFNPEPTSDEVYSLPAATTTAINLTGVPLPGRADWFYTPPPFCFGASTEEGWMSFGIEAKMGGNRFNDYTYHGGVNSFYLSLAYEGHTHVDGLYTLPAVGFDFAPDPYTLLAAHVHHLRAAGLVPQPVGAARPTWWSEPMFCGWGAQCHLANTLGGRAPEHATQAAYQNFMRELETNGIFPGTVVLDDKWQATYGNNEADITKWPDLPGFIRERHAANQHVLLWLKAWDPEGVPAEECITNAGGKPVAVDPTNPAYERRLRNSVRSMLSAEGLDADGFKIDFSARIPSGPGMRAWGSEWALELMHRYFAIIHDEAKRVKPDAFFITHTPHPYLAGLMDAIRLNDINTDHDVRRQMAHRARVAAIACPEALIDSDNWPIRDRASWREYLTMKPLPGIPALYYSSHFDSTGEPLTDDDYSLLRETWADYRRMIAAQKARPSAQKIRELGGAYLPVTNRLVKKLALSHTLPVATKPLKAWQNDSTLLEQEE